jgi:succinate dehydrogenase hydrophobic anchor subunit
MESTVCDINCNKTNEKNVQIMFIGFIILLLITASLMIYIWQETDESIASNVKTGLTIGLSIVDLICLGFLVYIWMNTTTSNRISSTIVLPYPTNIRYLLAFFFIVFVSYAVALQFTVEDTSTKNALSGVLGFMALIAGGFFFTYNTSNQTIRL